MKHLVANLFHVMMTDRVDVIFFIAGARLVSCERKNVSDVRFFPSSPKNQNRVMVGSKVSSLLL